MAERKASNRYYPPNFDPEKGSLNFQRRKQKSSGIIPSSSKTKQPGKTVRLEVPFDVWCTGCNKLHTKGSRFNAHKIRDGEYLSTEIFRFVMKCEFCKSTMEMRTDPKNKTYEMLDGMKKKTLDFQHDEVDHAPKTLSESEILKLEDPFYRLENKMNDQSNVEKILNPVLDELIEFKETRSDDYQMNSLLRERARGVRNRVFSDSVKYSSLGIPLDKVSVTDVEETKKINFVVKTAQSKQNQIRSTSIFGKSKAPEPKNKLIANILKNFKK